MLWPYYAKDWNIYCIQKLSLRDAHDRPCVYLRGRRSNQILHTTYLDDGHNSGGAGDRPVGEYHSKVAKKVERWRRKEGGI